MNILIRYKDYIISISTILIALIALIISIIDHHENRRHNEYSVTPILNISILSKDRFHGLFVSNQGYGPALIDSCIVFYETKRINIALLDSIFYIQCTNPIEFTPKFLVIDNGSVIRIGEDKFIWGADIGDLTGYYSAIDRFINNISIRIFYHSIYNKHFTTELYH
jgi:hypothetical protein